MVTIINFIVRIDCCSSWSRSRIKYLDKRRHSHLNSPYPGKSAWSVAGCRPKGHQGNVIAIAVGNASGQSRGAVRCRVRSDTLRAMRAKSPSHNNRHAIDRRPLLDSACMCIRGISHITAQRMLHSRCSPNPKVSGAGRYRLWGLDRICAASCHTAAVGWLNPRRHHSRGRLVDLVASVVEVTAALFKIFCFSQQRRGSWHFSRHSHKAGVCQGDAKQPAGHASDSGQRACLSLGRAGNVQALGSVSAPPYDAVLPGRHSSRCVRPMLRYWLPCPG